MRIALNGRDFLVWLALSGVSRVVPLAFVEVAVAISLLVVVALGKAVVETNRISKSRNPIACIIVIVSGSNAITYRTHSRHNIIVILCLRSNMGLIIT
jgi:hypothetical protein